MSFKRITALMLVTAAVTLCAAGSALAMPADSHVTAAVPASGQSAAPVFVTSSIPAPSDAGGTGTLLVVLLATGALLAGAAAGFGSARVAAGRGQLH
jgi:hypothetical protein